MKKILIIIVIVLLAIMAYFVVMDGFKIGGFQVLSYSGLKVKSEELNQKLEEATKLTTITFNTEKDNLVSATKELESKRTEYEDKIKYSDEEDVQYISQQEQYEIEVLWVKIGNYATQHGLVLQLDITASSTGATDRKDLYFTANGSYVGMSDFIAELEDDSKLEFKIENFKLVAVDKGNTLQGTFVVRDIPVKVGTTPVTNVPHTTNTTNENDTDNTTPQS